MTSFARLGDKAKCDDDSHGCKSCSHKVIGPAVQGSPDVIIDNKPALRQGDMGIHSGCCGDNTWVAVGGSKSVLINNKPAVRVGDETRHCGGVGVIIEGSPNIEVGD